MRRLLLAAALGLCFAAAFELSDDIVYAPSNEGLRPQRLTAFGRTHYYQLPEQPRGTLVVFHGCGRAARAFFPYDPDHCPECLGFPEHVAHAKQALAWGLALLALEPQDARHLCWSSSTRGYLVDDRPKALEVITGFLAAQNLTGKPVYLQGISSGGTTVLKFMSNVYATAEKAAAAAEEEGKEPFVLRISGIIAEEAAPDDFDAEDGDGRLRYPDFPPTIFIGMEKGNTLSRDAPPIRDWLRSSGVPSDIIEAPMRRVTPAYLSDRIPVITPDQSAAFAAGLQQIGLTDAEGWLLAEPAVTGAAKNASAPNHRWVPRLRRALPWLRAKSRPLSLAYRTSLVIQALNVAYARHDAVADYLTVCLAWLEAGGKANLTQLLEQHTVPGGRLSELTIRGFEPGSNPLPSVGALAPAPDLGAVAGAPAPEGVEVRAPRSAAARVAGIQRGVAALQALLLAAAAALFVTT